MSFPVHSIACFACAAGFLLNAEGKLIAQPEKPKVGPFVKVTATLVKGSIGGKEDVLITLRIDDGVALFANPVGVKDLEAAMTKVSITIDDQPAPAAIAYPMGTLVKCEVVGDYHIYEGTVIIHASVRRAEGDLRPLEVSVRTQGFRPTH